MQNQLAIAAIVLAGVSTAVAGYAVMENQQLRVQLEERKLIPTGDDGDLAVALAPQERGALEALPSEVEQRLRAVEARVEAVDKGLAVQEQEVAAAKAEARRAADGVVPAAGPGGGVDVSKGGGATAEQIRAMIKKQVEAEVEAGKVKDREKPSLGAVAAHLKLSDVQKSEVERAVLEGKQAVFDTLSIPTKDGTVFTEELTDTIVSMVTEGEMEGGAKFMKLFVRMNAEKIPGTDETYVQRMNTIKAGVTQQIQRDLTPEQFAEYEKMRVAQDPTEMKVAGDPWEKVMTDVAAKLPEDKKNALEEWQKEEEGK
ncbi:MAG: hypothetical protein ACYTGX_08110 [Planctomycetota bacterium]|jgi:hypothetical protein